jgi:hypothetical protein
MTVGYDPPTDYQKLAEQKVAALRLFFWTNLAVGETAVAQSQRARDPAIREQLDRLVAIELPEYRVPDDERNALEFRTRELTRLHEDAEDCRIVAEAELIGVPTLLTFDKTMQKRLRRAARIEILSPTEQWDRLAIPRGRDPIREPDATNPLSRRQPLLPPDCPPGLRPGVHGGLQPPVRASSAKRARRPPPPAITPN